MTRQGEVTSAAHAIAVDGCVDRGRELFDDKHQALAHLCELIRRRTIQGSDLRKIGARGKEIAATGDDERLRRTAKADHQLRQRLNASSRQAIGAIFRGQSQMGIGREVLEFYASVSGDRRHVCAQDTPRKRT